MATKPRRRRLRIAGLLAGLGLFAFLLRGVGTGVLVADLRAIGAGILVVLALELAVDVVNTIAWRCTLAPHDRGIGFPMLFLSRLAGTAFNQLVPAASVAGEPVKVMLLQGRVAPAQAWASVITAKLSHALAQTIFVVVGVALAFTRLRAPDTVAWALAAAFTATAAALVACLVLQRRGLFTTLASVARRLGVPAAAIDAFTGRTAALDAAISDLHTRRSRDLVRSVAWHLSGLAVGVLQMLLLLRWLGLGADIVTCAAIEAISLLAQLALFFVPASIGVQEGGKVLAFTALGLPASAGLAVGVAFRVVQVVTIALGLGAFAALSAVRPGSSRRRVPGSDRVPQ